MASVSWVSTPGPERVFSGPTVCGSTGLKVIGGGKGYGAGPPKMAAPAVAACIRLDKRRLCAKVRECRNCQS